MPPTTMLDKILFWVVLVWMIALLIMAIMAVREVWKEDSRDTTEPDSATPTDANAQDTRKPDSPGASQ